MEKEENQFKSPSVRLKGVGDSLCVILDPAQPIDCLQKELGRLFKQMKHLSVNARITLDVGEQDGCEELVEELGKFLKETFSVGSVSRSPKKQPAPERIRKRNVEHSWYHHQSDVLMLTGRVRSGQKVTARNIF